MNRTLPPSIRTIDSLTLPKIETLKLDNGVPVYVLNEGEQEVVKIELMFRAGKWYETKNLLADLANRMLREGTSGHTAREIADTFDFYGANLDTGSGFETAGTILYSLTREVDNVLPLLQEVLTDSIFPEKEFEIIANNRKQRLAVDLEKSDFLANRNFVNALFGQKHPYGRITEFDDFGQITVDDLKAFFKKYYHAANLIIIVSGKFGDSLVKKLNQYLGNKDWARNHPAEEIAYPVEQSVQLSHHTEKAGSVQSSVVVGNISINKTHPDFLGFSILNTLFGGYFGSRLMTNIREDKGYTYGIYSSLVSYPHAGFLEIGAEVHKDARQATLTEIEREINRLRNEPVSGEELQIVKNYMSGKILRSIDGPLKFSETLKNLIIYDQDTSYIQQFLKTVREITGEELFRLANQYLDFTRMYKVTVG